MNTHSIYALAAGPEGGIFYLGCSTNPKMRWYKHVSAARRGLTDQAVWPHVRSLLERGIQIELIVLETHTDRKRALEREAELTSTWKECGVQLVNEYTGTKMSTKSRLKMSAAQTAARQRPDVIAKHAATKNDPTYRFEHVKRLRNSGLSKANTSGVRGVSWNSDCKKWAAELKATGGRRIYLGLFVSLDDATAARKAAEAKYWADTNGGTDVP
jgi:predicted GIY-YIG superfamily endonuclease